MARKQGAMADAQRVAARAKPKERSRGSDSTTDELEAGSSSDGETLQRAKISAKKKVINQFTFSMYINTIYFTRSNLFHSQAGSAAAGDPL